MQRTASPARPRSLDELLDGRLVARLTQLDITSRKILAGKLKGERRSRRRGQSVEFADHRQYVAGDDLRHIDWNIFGRLDRLFLKLFLEEEDLSLHIVLDASASHDCGEPSKFLFMQRLAMALGYVGLANLHRVTVTAIAGADNDDSGGDTGPTAPLAGTDAPRPAPGAGRLLGTLRDLRGRRRARDLAEWLCDLRPAGAARFTDACKRIALSRRGKGVMIVLSDFFIKEGYETGLRLLLGRGYDVYALQVLSPQELKPTLAGDLRLRDVEDADTADVTISAPLLRRYEATITAYCARLRDFCARREIMHLALTSDTPPETVVLDYLRRQRLLR